MTPMMQWSFKFFILIEFHTINSFQDNSRTYSPSQASIRVKFLFFWAKQGPVSHWARFVSKICISNLINAWLFGKDVLCQPGFLTDMLEFQKTTMYMFLC